MRSYPFTSQVTYDDEGLPLYDRAVDSSFLRRVFAQYFSDGVFYKPTSALQVVADTGMQVAVEPGCCHIQGAIGIEDSRRTLVVQAAESLDRIDTVVARLDLSLAARDIDLYVVKGTAAASPQPPELTRDATVWELGLANLFVAKNTQTISQQRITDTRLDSARCGVVAQTIGALDTEPYYTQLSAMIDDLREVIAGIEAGSEVMLKTVYDPRGVAKDVFAQIPNPNELTNSGFMKAQRVNQRGASGTISSAGYFIDRWKLVSGTVQLTDEGLVLNGTIEQILENAIGTPFSASVSAGTASYDDASKTFSITGTGETISWAKLEKGDVATPWQPKGYGAELAECIRFFRQIRVDWQTYSGAGYNARVPVALVPPMRTAPTASDASRYVFNCTLSGLEFSTSQGGAIALSVPGEGATAYSSLLKLSADL